MKVVECVSVWKCYGSVVALQDVSFHVNKGEIYCVLGPNGSGKTTLLEGLVGLRKFDKGRVIILGHEVSAGRLPQEIAKRIGIVFEESQLLPWLTVEENIRYVAKLYGVELARSDITHALELVGLDQDKRTRLYRHLSKGEKRKVEIAAIIALKPELVIMDEPTSGLDPDSRLEVLELLSRLNKTENITVIFSTHILEDAEKVGDRILLLIRGRKIAEGSPDEITRSFRIPWRVMVILPEGTTAVEIRKAVLDVLPDVVINEASRHGLNVLVLEVEDVDKALRLVEMLRARFSKAQIRIVPPRLEDVFIKLVREQGRV